MLDYLENPYVLAISIVVGAVLVLLFYTFVSDGPVESGKSSQRFVLPCMINPATLDTEDEDEDVPHDDLSKVKGEVNIENEPKVVQGDGPLNLVSTLKKKSLNEPEIIKTSADENEEENCIKSTSVLEAELKIKASLSEQELQNEREIQRQQLAAIFELMNKQSDKFGDMSMNDVKEQMKMYR